MKIETKKDVFVGVSLFWALPAMLCALQTRLIAEDQSTMKEVYRNDIDIVRLSERETHSSLAKILVERGKARQISELIVAAGNEDRGNLSLCIKYLGVAKEIDEQLFIERIKVFIKELGDKNSEVIMRIMAFVKRSGAQGIVDDKLIIKAFNSSDLGVAALKDNGLLIDALIFSIENTSFQKPTDELVDSLRSLKNIAADRYDSSLNLESRINNLIESFQKLKRSSKGKR
jgi:sulfite reductase alpha subunit-like flavoprotein